MFDETEVNPTGRNTMGVKGISLKSEDEVAGALIITSKTTHIASITAQGYIKQTKLSEFSKGSRANKGVMCHKISPDDKVVGFSPIALDNKEAVISSNYSTIKINVGEIPTSGRNTQGNRSIKLNENQIVKGMMVI